MLQQLNQRLTLAPGVTEFSPSVHLTDANAVRVAVTALAASGPLGGGVGVFLQGSNDGTNWFEIWGAVAPMVLGLVPQLSTRMDYQITWAIVRLMYVGDASATVELDANLNGCRSSFS